MVILTCLMWWKRESTKVAGLDDLFYELRRSESECGGLIIRHPDYDSAVVGSCVYFLSLLAFVLFYILEWRTVHTLL